MENKVNRDFRVLVLITVILVGCHDRSDSSNIPKAYMSNEVTVLSERQSGYSAGVPQWTQFLSCWYEAQQVRHQALLIETPDFPYSPVLRLKPQAPGESDALAYSDAESDKLERRLGVALPRSYRDFLSAYLYRHDLKSNVVTTESTVGMYLPEAVGRLIDLDPDLIKIAQQFDFESDDAEYFVYGTKQDDSSSRTSNRNSAIVVGKYGNASQEYILLYPEMRTQDGEMEAALIAHASEFRAPSFAELMRQLSVLKTQVVDSIPPYSQQQLHHTCAAKLPLKSVWWE